MSTPPAPTPPPGWTLPRLRIDAEGTWYDDDVEITHPGIVANLQGNLRRDAEGYFIRTRVRIPVLVADVPGYTGGYDWTVPADATYEAEIRISDAWDGSPSDVSDTPFTILAPGIVALPDPLDLGTILTGTTKHDTLHFENPGTATLSITSITSSHAEFRVSRTAFSIPAGETDTVTVLYHPLTAGADSALGLRLGSPLRSWTGATVDD